MHIWLARVSRSGYWRWVARSASLAGLLLAHLVCCQDNRA